MQKEAYNRMYPKVSGLSP